jgi:putative transposase
VKILNKAYKFRLYPNQEQSTLISKTFGCVRFVYNKMLAERKDTYNKYKDNKTELKKQKLPTPAKYKDEFLWLKEVDSLALANAQLNLQSAYNKFFREHKGFPKFKSKKHPIQSYTTNNQGGNIRIKDNKIKLPKIGWVRCKVHRQIAENEIIKSCTISRTPTGKYYVSILVEYDKEIQPIQVDKNNILGLDMDMKNLYTDSQGIKAEYPRFYRKMLDKLVVEERKLSRCKLGSNNRNKQRIKVAKLHEKVANQRKDFLHKLSKQLADNYDAVVIEDLNMQGMSQTLNLGKSVADNGWGMFTTMLKYKLEWQGKQLVKVDKWFPSSQLCSDCGFQNPETKDLSVREWICPNCGEKHNRDHNAAINIKNEGIRMLFA